MKHKLLVFSWFWLVAIFMVIFLKLALIVPVGTGKLFPLPGSPQMILAFVTFPPMAVLVAMIIWTGIRLLIVRFSSWGVLTKARSALIGALLGFLVDFTVSLWTTWIIVSVVARQRTVWAFLKENPESLLLLGIISFGGAVAGAVIGFGFSYVYGQESNLGTEG